jgi:hypothetical protein
LVTAALVSVSTALREREPSSEARWRFALRRDSFAARRPLLRAERSRVACCFWDFFEGNGASFFLSAWFDHFHKYCEVIDSHEEQLFLTEKLRQQFLQAYTFVKRGGRVVSLRPVYYRKSQS